MVQISPRQSDVRRIAFVSLGCPKNLVDSEKMLGELASAGLELVDSDKQADAIVINTCGFLEASKQESLDVINEAIERKNRGDLKRVIVAGCLVQRHRAKMLEWAPGIDAMIGVFDRDHILDAVSGASRRILAADDVGVPKYWITGNALQAAKERGFKTVGLTVNGADGKGIGYFEDDSNRFRLTPRHWAYLRVSEGCNQKCAFCTIPSIRGKMRSKPLDRIIDEARALMADGAFELNLIGQDTTSFGYDIYGQTPGLTTEGRKTRIAPDPKYPGNLIGLLTALNDVARDHGSGWMRLMYVYPTHFTDAMIEAIASLPNIVKYIDIPLQHMSDNMLKAMRRNITRGQQEELLHKLRERIPGLAIRTTFITGFPGETEEDHEELMDFVDEFGFDMMGVFQYSREDGTPAGTMDRDPELHVPDDVKARRERELMLLQQEIAFENAKYVAQQKCEFDVLIEREVQGGFTTEHTESTERAVRASRASTDSFSVSSVCSVVSKVYLGRCYHQAPQVDSVTYVRSRAKFSPGELVRCTVVGSDGYDLIAQPSAELSKKLSLPIAR